MLTEAERRTFIATRRPMTMEELNEARDVLCKYVEPETSVAYHFTLLLLEVERAQAVAALAAPAPSSSPASPAPGAGTERKGPTVTCDAHEGEHVFRDDCANAMNVPGAASTSGTTHEAVKEYGMACRRAGVDAYLKRATPGVEEESSRAFDALLSAVDALRAEKDAARASAERRGEALSEAKRERDEWQRRAVAEAMRATAAESSLALAREEARRAGIEEAAARVDSGLRLGVPAAEIRAALRALAPTPAPSPAPLAEWYLADGSTVLLPVEEVTRRRIAAAVVLRRAREVRLDDGQDRLEDPLGWQDRHDAGFGRIHVRALADLYVALDAVDLAPPPVSSPTDPNERKD